MHKLRELISVKEERGNYINIFLLFAIVYIFAIAVRLIWVYQFSGSEDMHWNNQLMINTNDGYQWVEGANDILRDEKFYKDSTTTASISILTALFIKYLPFSTETIILYMPTFLGSLLALPVLLIGVLLRQTYVGFVAASIGSVVWSYYNRTMTGYYDTDLLVIVLPTFVLLFLMYSVMSKRWYSLLFLFLSIMLYQWWYGGGYSLLVAMVAMTIGYTIIFERREYFNYLVLATMLISVVSFNIYLQSILVLSIIAYVYFLKLNKKFVFAIFGISIVLFAVNGGFSPILHQLNNYVFRSLNAADEVSLQFFSVAQTVREAGMIPFETFANRISGHTITFFLSTFGYILFALRYPILWLALPMMGLGFLALKGGLRFTVYAVPINALGISYLIFLFAKYMQFVLPKNIASLGRYSMIFVLSSAVLYPNIVHVIGYKVPTVFTKTEVNVLDKLKGIATHKDYAISWWDYGYPIRYYGELNTLVDGGAHEGSQNYPVSFALMKPQLESALMSRLDVESSEKRIKNPDGTHSLWGILKDSGYKDVNKFLADLAQNKVPLPTKTTDIYYYLPNRMLQILPTVDLFSNMDVTTGKQYPRGFFYFAQRFSQASDGIELGNGVKILQDNHIQIGKNKIPMRDFYVTAYGNDGKLQVQRTSVNSSAQLSVIFMKNYNVFLVMDNRMLASTYIQLFVLENYDKNLFEPVILDPLAKVYKLKI